MKITKASTILLLIISLLTTKISAQGNLITLRVIDNLTKKPVRDAAIYAGDSIISKTNKLGFSQANALSGDTILLRCNDYNEKIAIVPIEQKFQVGLDLKDDKLDFTGGVRSFYDHWGSNLRYPGKAKSKKTQANIYVEFTVDSTGHSHLVKIHNDTYNLFEQEVRRVFKSMTGKWSADYSNKTFLLPIKFRVGSIRPLTDSDLSGVNSDRELNEVVVVTF